MSFIFSPKRAKPAPAAPVPVAKKIKEDTKVADEESKKKREKVRVANAGTAGTLLTSPLGDKTRPSILKPKLGGGKKAA